MKLADHFGVLLRDKVNLSQFRLDQLEKRVNAVYEALKKDEILGPLLEEKIPQGSWEQRTIINPVGNNEFDADVMLLFEENPDWSENPKTYIQELYNALGRNSTYKEMPRNRKCRCVRLTYANDCHIDLVPYLKLGGYREVIVNRDENTWEDTDPEGFTEWMKSRDGEAKGNLRKVIRLFKFLRDHKNSFTGTRSIILTTLLGNQVNSLNALADPSYYGSVPDALLHITEDLDIYLQANPIMPVIADPSGSGTTFNHRWGQESYSYFRDRVHAHRAEIDAAYHEEDKEQSVKLWQGIFGDGFKAPASAASKAKFGLPVVAPALPTTLGRSGRAG